MGLLPKKFSGKFRARPSILSLSTTADLRRRTVEPMWPFMVAGLIVAYGINAGANAMMACTTLFRLSLEVNAYSTAFGCPGR